MKVQKLLRSGRSMFFQFHCARRPGVLTMLFIDSCFTFMGWRRESLATDTVSERLRRWTRNPLGSARRGSNPLGVAFPRFLPFLRFFQLAVGERAVVCKHDTRGNGREEGATLASQRVALAIALRRANPYACAVARPLRTAARWLQWYLKLALEHTRPRCAPPCAQVFSHGFEVSRDVKTSVGRAVPFCKLPSWPNGHGVGCRVRGRTARPLQAGALYAHGSCVVDGARGGN